MPSTLVRLALTGKTVPPNGLLTRFHSTVRPTLPGASDAPITATAFGPKKTLTERGRRIGCSRVASVIPVSDAITRPSSALSRQLQIHPAAMFVSYHNQPDFHTTFCKRAKTP